MDSAAGGRAHRVGGLLHAIGERAGARVRAPASAAACCSRFASALSLPSLPSLPPFPLAAPCCFSPSSTRRSALGEALLFARQPAKRILAALALAGSAARLGRNLPLGVGELPRLELQIAKRAPAAVRRACLQLAFELAQFVERALRARARLVGILSPEIAGGAAHLLGDVAHVAAVFSGPSRLSLLLAGLLPGWSGFAGVLA